MLLPEDIPDFRGRAAWAKGISDAPAAKQLGLEWRTQAAVWLQRGRLDSVADKAPSRKQHRKKACEWLIVSDNQLRVGCNMDWKFFSVKEDEASDLASWPHIVINADNGTDGTCGYNWLVRTQRVNAEWFADPAHGVANDLKGALFACAVWKHTLLLTAMLNVPFGPWSEQRFFFSSSARLFASISSQPRVRRAHSFSNMLLQL